MATELSGRINQPFAEQIDFFRQKLNLTTEAWDDIWQAAHDRAFVVAGATRADLLNDLRAAVDKAVAQGTSLRTFQNEFREIVARHGWTGWTGEGRQAGEAWRTRVILETNLRTSWAAGRWQQLNDPELKAERPFWRYVHSGLAHEPRAQHKAWSDARLTLPADDPFWQVYYPPNGWGCGCRVVSERAPAAGAQTTPPPGWDSDTPPGVDEGWAYAPGASWHPDLDRYPYEMARQIVAGNLDDGVFERWQNRIANQVRDEREKPRHEGLTGRALSDALRGALKSDERYPVAVLNDLARQALQTRTQTVYLSADTTIKQAVHRDQQEMPVGLWGRLQDAVDYAKWVVREGENHLMYYHEDRDLMVAVIKVAADKSDAWLLSVRKADTKQLERDIRNGRAVRWN